MTTPSTPIPTLTKITPSVGKTAGGTTVTLTGSGFVTGATVTFGSGNHGTTVHVSGTASLTVKAPAHAAGTVTVTVTTSGGTSGTKPYAYDPIPTITSLSRTSGPTSGGTKVTITGTGFSTAAHVKFGTTTAVFTVNSSTSITATAPAHAAGTAVISVTTPGGTTPTTSADHFKYTVPSPVIFSISPTTGKAGTSVTLSGSGFISGATTVTFGGTVIPAGSVTFVSGSQIKVTSPAHAAGTVTVKATTAAGTSASGEHFTYVTGPTITSLSRTTGPVAGGTKVTITGTGFTTVTKVTFGSTTATKWTIRSNNQLVVTAPAHAAGRVGISVTTTGGASPTTSADYYTYH
ncbi:MAG: IPT/TIG domain-containing protein [Acidimicrobiales bacterium]